MKPDSGMGTLSPWTLRSLDRDDPTGAAHRAGARGAGARCSEDGVAWAKPGWEAAESREPPCVPVQSQLTHPSWSVPA